MNIIDDAQKYVSALFDKYISDKLRYHNIRHTENVVVAARLIASECNISGAELEMLLVAAWFHDVGYLETIKDHETLSGKKARVFLEKRGKDRFFIDQVERCIAATKIPQSPIDRLSAILCDADLFYLSQDDFMTDTRIFWNELAAINGQAESDAAYLKQSLRFFENHSYKTDYGKTVLEPGKVANIQKIKAALKHRL